MAYSAQKCVVSIPVSTGGTEAQIGTSFARFEGQSNVLNQYGINSSGRFNSVQPLYEQYAVTGMTLEWIPSNLNGSANNQGTSGLIN